MEKVNALKILRELHDKALFSERTALETLHPELKESDDEKIRKGIISGMKALQEKGKYTRFANIPMDDVFAWLKKQGEQKPQRMISAEAKEAMYGKPAYAWSEEDERIRKVLINLVKNNGTSYYIDKIHKDDILAWLEKQSTPAKLSEEELDDKLKLLRSQPKQGWSEEDEEIINKISVAVATHYSCDTAVKVENWLKSLRPQNKWKPTKEQMDALLFVIQHYTPNVTDKLAWDSIKILELMYYEIKQ